MKNYKTYIAIKKFSGRAICGNLTIKKGEPLFVVHDFIFSSRGPICTVTSQVAYDYFTQNDDNSGTERGELTQKILKKIRTLKEKNLSLYNRVWDKIWEDPICLKYKRIEHADHWVWNYDFYNAEIADLNHIYNLILKG